MCEIKFLLLLCPDIDDGTDVPFFQVIPEAITCNYEGAVARSVPHGYRGAPSNARVLEGEIAQRTTDGEHAANAAHLHKAALLSHALSLRFTRRPMILRYPEVTSRIDRESAGIADIGNMQP